MRTVKGVYRNGVITLVEPAPMAEKQEVTVVIPDAEAPRTDPLQFAGMLRDVSPEEAAAFDEALRRGVRFTRKAPP